MDSSSLFAYNDGAIETDVRSRDVTSRRRFRPSSSRGQNTRPSSSRGQSSRPSSFRGQRSRPSILRGQSFRPSSSRGQSSRPLNSRGQSSQPPSYRGQNSRPSSSRSQSSLGQRSLGQSSYQRTPKKVFPEKTRSKALPSSENSENEGLRKLVMKLNKVMHEDEGALNEDVIWLSTKKSGFQDFLSMQLSNSMKEKILLACGRLVQVDGARQSLLDVLMTIIRSSFSDKIISLLSENLTKRSGENTRAANQVSSCLHLVNAFMDYIPRHSTKEVSSLVLVLGQVIQQLNIEGVDDIQTRFLDVVQRKNEIIQTCESFRKFRITNEAFEPEPPDSFRTHSVFPTVEDITRIDKPFLRKNRIDASYASEEEYLDVQFRLLKEDFVRPFRNAVIQYKKLGTAANDHEVAKLDDIKVYRNARILFPEPTNKGMQYVVHFNIEPLQHIDWESSKRFMFGNLICLSTDDFKENFLFGTVTDRETKKLKKGDLMVEFIGGDDDEEAPNIDMSMEYTLVETNAFFAACHHVLAGLQEIRDLPLSRYIVNCSLDMRPPMYLRNLSLDYDFTPVLKNKHHPRINVCDLERWPSASSFGLDKSQQHALQTALTNEVALIQGPPGTGKTHVGLKVMQLLLANGKPSISRQDDPKHPILVVCYTNHALDQFLEGILKFNEGGIVRVGGRCKSEELEQYMLKNKRKNNSNSIFRIVKDDIEDAKRSLMKPSEMLHASNQCIVSLVQLERVISPRLFQQFVKSYSLGKFYSSYSIALLTWLGFSEPNNLTPASYIVQEVLSVWAVSFSQDNSWRRIKQAVAGTESLDKPKIANWLRNREESSERAYINPEIVGSFLEDQLIPTSVAHLVDKFSQIEVKCALFVLTNRLKDKVPINHPKFADTVAKWLESRSQQNEVVSDVGANVHGEVEFIIEQRQMDTDCERKEMNVDDVCKRISAATYTNIHCNHVDEFKLSKKEKKTKTSLLKKELYKTAAMSMQDVEMVDDIMTLSTENRWRLYRAWVDMWRASYRNKIQAETQSFNALTRKLEELQNEVDLSILGRADVIGMTTTGAARCRNILNRLPVKVVVVEEAAEVLEAHIITSMPKSTEHLILIGDHQQLKPSANVYELATKMNLEISLFERLVRNNLPYAKLTCQHRMRPRIADLLRPHIYETLTDNKNVMEYEDIWGVDQSVFFISHQHKEDMIVDGKTKMNQHEAEFIVALCKYLLLQEYKPSQITILTTYTGQLLTLKSIINKSAVELKDVYVTAVDNYQGEENDIILLSLVRSNELRSIGFLKIHNRVCVALSRAKKGLFCIGNMKLLQKESNVWDTIVKSLEEDQLIGSGLTLKCRNHPETCVPAKYAEDFKKFPGGGCGVLCLYRLNCGHSCTRTCHLDDRDHSKFQCMIPCAKSCPLKHRCLKKCWKECGICPVLMDKKMPECGHMQQMKCGIKPEDFKCRMPCPVILDCGHQCMDLCGSPCGPCKTIIKKTIPECGHIQEMECNVEPTRFWCQSPCKKTFACGHKCPDKCYEFCLSCHVKVDKTLPKCGHQQKIECYINPMFLKCKAVCEKQLSCGHQCKGICSQECPDCKVLVIKKLGCGHDQRLRCSRDVNNVKCLSRCEKRLSCGHQCKEECWNDVCTTVCLTKVKVNLSCGHEDDVSCIASSNPSRISCKKLCGKTLGCGHKCKGSCSNCLQGRFHMKCQIKCLKKLDCGHTCNGLCSMECPPCTKKCDNSCKHRKCREICGRPCTRCRSLCTWSCPHMKCTKLCGEACDRSPCNEHCTKTLKCGHSCIGLCGEPCPKLCRVCDKKVVTKSLTGDESLATARFVELPKCGHIFTHTVLDKLMGVKDVVKSSEQTVKHCPQCKTPILQCVRYGQLLSQTWRDRVLVKPMQKPSRYIVRNVRVKYNKTFATVSASSELIKAAFLLYQKISEKQTNQQLNFKLMKLNYIYRLLEIQTRIKKMLGGKNTQNDALKRTKEIADTVDFLERRLLAEKDGYTAQESKEFTNELNRIDSLLK